MAYGWLDTITEISKIARSRCFAACVVQFLKQSKSCRVEARIEIFNSLDFELESSGFSGAFRPDKD